MKKLYLVMSLILMLQVLAVSLNAIDVTIGTGDQQGHKPINFFYRYSMFESLYYPAEINQAGYIEAITYYNNSTDTGNTNHHLKIWMGVTDATDLSSGWVTSSNLVMVFNSHVSFPVGQNAIRLNLNHPILYNGGNLVIMTQSLGNNPVPAGMHTFFCQTVGVNRSREFYSDQTTPSASAPPMTGMHLNLSGQFPKTTLHFNNTPVPIDLGITAFTGPTTMTIDQNYTHYVTVSNLGTTAQSTYTVKLYDWNNQELASAQGSALASGASTEIPLSWTPITGEGYSTIYAKVILTGDQNLFNNTSQVMNVVFLPKEEEILNPPDPILTVIPFDMNANNSLFETIIPASYLVNHNVTGNRLITSIKFHNNFTDNLLNKSTKIWLGNTNQMNLATGWIPSGQLTSVFDGNVNYPSGLNTIEIILQNPFFYTGGNLVLMVNRPPDTNVYSGNNRFLCYTGDTNVSRNVASNTIVYNPAAPPEGISSLTNLYPATDFTCSYNNLGSLKGTIGNSQNLPITGANVLANPSNVSVTTNASGLFDFAWMLPGIYDLTVSAPGYFDQTVSVTVTAMENTVCNIRMHSIYDLVITGRVVSYDNPEYGIAHATVEIVGAVTTAVATNSLGYFTMYDVQANQTYVLRAMHPSYMTYYGSVAMQNVNENVGDLLLLTDTTSNSNEVAVLTNSLSNSYPNPFRTSTTISYDVKEPTHTSIEIYNVRGQKVKTLVSEFTKSGQHSVVWEGTDNHGSKVSSGIYYYKMHSGYYTSTRKIVIIR